MWVAVALAATSVQHVGTVSGESIAWVSTWDSAADCVPLAGPFVPPAGFWVTEEGLCREPGTPWRVVHSQPFPDEGLRLPMPVGALQRVDLSGARFDPDPSMGLAKGLGSWATVGVGTKERRALDRRLDRGRGTTRLYLQPAADTVVVGRVVEAGPTLGAKAGAAAVFLAVGAMLAGLYRLLERKARAERFASWLAEQSGEPPL